MKKILFVVLLLPLFVGAQVQLPQLKALQVSKEKDGSRPIIVYSNYRTHINIDVWDSAIKEYKNYKFSPTQDFVERGYGFYNDYVFKQKTGVFKFRVLDEYDKRHLVLLDYSEGSRSVKKEVEMINIF